MAESQEEFFRKLSEHKKGTFKTKEGGNVLDLTHLEMPPSTAGGEITTPLQVTGKKGEVSGIMSNQRFEVEGSKFYGRSGQGKPVKSTLISGPQEQAYKQKTPNPSKFISEQKINAIVTLISQQVENISETYQIRTGTQLTSRNIRKGSIPYQMMKTSKKPSEGLATPGEQIEGHLSSVLKSSSDPEKPHYTFKTTKLNKPFSHDLKISGEATREIIRKRVIPMLFAKDKDKKSKFFLGKSKEAIEKMVSDQPDHGITYEVKMSEPRGEGPSGYEQAGFKNLPINVSGEDVGITANRGQIPGSYSKPDPKQLEKLPTGKMGSSLGLTVEPQSVESLVHTGWSEDWDEGATSLTQRDLERRQIEGSESIGEDVKNAPKAYKTSSVLQTIEAGSDDLIAETDAPKVLAKLKAHSDVAAEDLRATGKLKIITPGIQRLLQWKEAIVFAADKGQETGLTVPKGRIPGSGYPSLEFDFNIKDQESYRIKAQDKSFMPVAKKPVEEVKAKSASSAELADAPSKRTVLTPAGKLIRTEVSRGKSNVGATFEVEPTVIEGKESTATGVIRKTSPIRRYPALGPTVKKTTLLTAPAEPRLPDKPADTPKKVYEVNPKTKIPPYANKGVSTSSGKDVELVKSRTSGEFVTKQLRRRIALKKSGENVAQGIGKGFRFGILGLPYLQIGSTIIQGMRLSKEKKKEGGDLKILDFLPDYAKKQYQQSIGTIPRS